MSESETLGTWPPERAWEWRRRVGWLIGCNYVPAYACNQLELWSAETFDAAAIDRELADAAARQPIWVRQWYLTRRVRHLPHRLPVAVEEHRP